MIADAPLLGVRQPHNEDTRVRAGLELPRVGEIEVVGHQETAFGLRGGPYVLVAPTTKLLV